MEDVMDAAIESVMDKTIDNIMIFTFKYLILKQFILYNPIIVNQLIDLIYAVFQCFSKKGTAHLKLVYGLVWRLP